MYDGVISAPTGLDPMADDLTKAGAAIRTLMERLQTATAKLMAASEGDMFIALQEENNAYTNPGLAHADTTEAAARLTRDFRTNMVATDVRGRHMFEDL
jgi:hypothetical protein